MATKADNLTISILSGPVDVAYRREDGFWLCVAMQFSLIGNGKTREEAFQMMREMVNDHLAHTIQARRPVAFFHEARSQEWDKAGRKRYAVALVYTAPKGKAVAPAGKIAPRDLRTLRNRLVSTNFIPSSVLGLAA